MSRAEVRANLFLLRFADGYGRVSLGGVPQSVVNDIRERLPAPPQLGEHRLFSFVEAGRPVFGYLQVVSPPDSRVVAGAHVLVFEVGLEPDALEAAANGWLIERYVGTGRMAELVAIGISQSPEGAASLLETYCVDHVETSGAVSREAAEAPTRLAQSEDRAAAELATELGPKRLHEHLEPSTPARRAHQVARTPTTPLASLPRRAAPVNRAWLPLAGAALAMTLFVTSGVLVMRALLEGGDDGKVSSSRVEHAITMVPAGPVSRSPSPSDDGAAVLQEPESGDPGVGAPARKVIASVGPPASPEASSGLGEPAAPLDVVIVAPDNGPSLSDDRETDEGLADSQSHDRPRVDSASVASSAGLPVLVLVEEDDDLVLFDMEESLARWRMRGDGRTWSPTVADPTGTCARVRARLHTHGGKHQEKVLVGKRFARKFFFRFEFKSVVEQPPAVKVVFTCSDPRHDVQPLTLTFELIKA